MAYSEKTSSLLAVPVLLLPKGGVTTPVVLSRMEVAGTAAPICCGLTTVDPEPPMAGVANSSACFEHELIVKAMAAADMNTTFLLFILIFVLFVVEKDAL